MFECLPKRENKTLTSFFMLLQNILPLLHVYDFELEVEKHKQQNIVLINYGSIDLIKFIINEFHLNFNPHISETFNIKNNI